MIIGNLNIKAIIIFPYKTYAPLIIDPYAKFSSSIAFQFFQSI